MPRAKRVHCCDYCRNDFMSASPNAKWCSRQCHAKSKIRTIDGDKSAYRREYEKNYYKQKSDEIKRARYIRRDRRIGGVCVNGHDLTEKIVGKDSSCLQCRKDAQKQEHIRNRRNAWMREYWKSRKDIKSAASKEYRLRNIDKIKAHRREVRQMPGYLEKAYAYQCQYYIRRFGSVSAGHRYYWNRWQERNPDYVHPPRLQFVRLDAPMYNSGGGGTKHELVTDDSALDPYEFAENREQLSWAIKQLSSDELSVMVAFADNQFDFDLTAEDLEMSVECVRDIVIGVQCRMKHAVQ